jgi:hypothetical protein
LDYYKYCYLFVTLLVIAIQSNMVRSTRHTSKRQKLPMTRQQANNKKRRKVSIDPLLSPDSKAIKRTQDCAVQIQAFNELMNNHASIGGEDHGDIQRIVDKYKKKGHNVERW